MREIARALSAVVSAQACFAAWLRKYRPEAILSDIPETRKYLGELGYRIPKDIGLAATSVLDGNADAGVEQNSEEIGKAAVETLLSLLNHNLVGVPQIVREVVITGTWVDGSSLPPRQQVSSPPRSSSRKSNRQRIEC
jgi:LacI family transcriptional regulator